MLGGCSDGGSPDLSADAAEELQVAVLEVSRAAAQGRYDAAAASIEDVRAVLVAAAEDGEVSAARLARVESALRGVEAELEELRATQTSAGDVLVGPDGGSDAD